MAEEEQKAPQHLHFLNSGLNWDWRKENAVELILLVFLLAFFFTLPRAGCGITDPETASKDPTIRSAQQVGTPRGGAAPAAQGAPEG